MSVERIRELIEAFDHFDNKYKRAEVEEAISRLSVEGSVHLVGAQSYGDVPAYYALAGAFVHASTTEQWGLVVNEAMASGLPVLVSNRCGCAPDLVQEGVNGFTFDPCNVEELAQLMLKISAFQPVSFLEWTRSPVVSQPSTPKPSTPLVP